MISITIIAIVVVAVLTVIIFSLAWLGFSSCLRAYEAEVNQGQHDLNIYTEYFKRNKSKSVIVKVLSYTMTFILLLVLIILLVLGFVYGSNDKDLTINGYTPLVIKSGSMSGFYNSNVEAEYLELGYSKHLQFDVGDICIFEKADINNLIIGEVYAYKYKGVTITHRLIGIHYITDDLGNITGTYYLFKGDNNPSKDPTLISADKIVYHYTAKKIPTLGAFVLYAQSTFGIWSLLCLVCIIVSSDIVLNKINNINKKRADIIGGFYER